MILMLTQKKSLGTTVELLPYDLEVMSSSKKKEPLTMQDIIDASSEFRIDWSFMYPTILFGMLFQYFCFLLMLTIEYNSSCRI